MSELEILQIILRSAVVGLAVIGVLHAWGRAKQYVLAQARKIKENIDKNLHYTQDLDKAKKFTRGISEGYHEFHKKNNQYKQ